MRRGGPRGVPETRARPKPKQLDSPPTAFEVAPAADGETPVAASRRGSRDRPATGSATTAAGDEPAALTEPDRAVEAADLEVHEAARRIAAKLSIPRPPQAAGGRGGDGPPRSVPYREGLDEIDLDRTLETLAERPHPRDEDVVMRDPALRRRAVVLAVDLSGSMRGERLRTAAATVGALCGELARDRLAVVAFWSDAAWLAHLDAPVSSRRLVDALLDIPARGLTNVAFPLELAARELGGGDGGGDARVLLLSDCVHNAGPDPRRFATALPRLDVLLDVTGETDVALGRDLARLGRGRLLPIASHRDVPSALRRAFSP